MPKKSIPKINIDNVPPPPTCTSGLNTLNLQGQPFNIKERRHGQLKRRTAREHALKALYRLDILSQGPVDKSPEDEDPAGKSPEDESPAGTGPGGEVPEAGEVAALCADKSPEVAAFCTEIVQGTIKHLSDIDAAIKRSAEHWVLERMATVDRNILRAATFELLYRADIPTAVTINEALEIAKKFSGQEAAAFINGILDKIAKSRATG